MEDAAAQHRGVHDVEGNEGSGMRCGGRSASLEVNRTIAFVDANNFSGILPGPRISDFERPVDRMVLGWKAVPIDYRALYAADFSH